MTIVSLVQAPAELLEADDAGAADLAQAAVELLQSDEGAALLTQLAVEVLYVEPGAYIGVVDGVPWKRTGTKVSTGTSVDDMTLTFLPPIEAQFHGLPWPHAVRAGILDGARIVVERVAIADWRDALGTPQVNTSADTGSVILFSGRVSDSKVARNKIDVEVKSDLELLNVPMPRNLYQPGCVHTLFDSGCALAKAAFADNQVVTPGSTKTVIVASASAQATGFYDLGTIEFTSGANRGEKRTVKTYLGPGDGTSFEVAPALPAIPADDDTFDAYVGCNKVRRFKDGSAGDCITKFSNEVHFRGFEYVPAAESAR